LSRGAEAFGFNARQVKATNQIIDRLSEAPLPAIIHWKGYHWVVLYGKKGKNYVIADPGVGIRYLTRRELIAGWGNGVMLLLTPDDSRFYEQENDKVGGFSRYIQRVWPYRQGKTTITISHRPKVIQRADWIVMLEKGQLKIQGTPEDLHSLTGDHLNFLDDVVPSTKNLVLLPSDSHSHLNGKLSHT
jgi:ABC-type bacteriocin/lantibiotic exporter with double-glycine peptidase domain